MLVKDAMVLIHLAKMTLLGTCCQVFGPVHIPRRVEEEVLAGKQKGHADAVVVETLVDEGQIRVVELDEEAQASLDKLDKLNVRDGEAHAVALCRQEEIGQLATDDDNVRNRQEILHLRCIGTPALLLSLLKRGEIGRDKAHRATDILEDAGWFSQGVLDKVRMEVDRWETP